MKKLGLSESELSEMGFEQIVHVVPFQEGYEMGGCNPDRPNPCGPDQGSPCNPCNPNTHCGPNSCRPVR